MWHDNETTTDLLGYERFADTIYSLNEQEDLLPMTIGLFGDWGSGKSSILGMVEQRYLSKPNSLCLRFDGWLFEGYDDAKAALMTDIITAITAKKKENQTIGEKAKSLFKRVNWFRMAGLAAKGVLSLTTPLSLLSVVGSTPDLAKKILEDPTSSFEKLKGLICLEANEVFENIREFRQEFETLIIESGLSPVVILLDDLDRCLPDSIISTLEAIKLFLAVKGTVFVIAADERIIRHAINHRYPPEKYQDQDLPQDYLEKLIQIPIRIPPLSERDVSCYLYLLFAQKALGPQDEQFKTLCSRAKENRNRSDFPDPMNYGIAAEVLNDRAKALEYDYALVDRISGPLTSGLDGNPRLVKRFLNTFSLRLTMAKAIGLDIQPDILCKLMVLERFHEERFIELFNWQSSQNGLPEQLSKLKKAVEEQNEEGLNEDEKVWLLDEDLKNWLVSAPSFESTPLTEYFYISRETIRISTKGTKQLPPALQKILANLQSNTVSIQTSAVNSLKTKRKEEVLAVYEAIIPKAIKEPCSKNMQGLVKLASSDIDVATKLLIDSEKIDPAALDGGQVFRIASLKNEHPSLVSNVDNLLRKWQKCTKKGVTNAAKRALNPTLNLPRSTRAIHRGIHGG